MSWRARACVGALVAALALGAPARAWAVAPTPGLTGMVFGDESAAIADDARAALFNPAAASLRYPVDLAFAWQRDRPRGELNHLLFARDGFAARITRIKDSTEYYGVSFARGNSERLRVGLGPTWLVNAQTHEVATDWRLGALARPTPWLSLGGIAEHLLQSDFQSRRLGRAYDLGVGFRPLALERARAHTLGTDLTLTADAVVPEDGEWSQTRVRVGVAVEPIAGLLLRASFQDHRGMNVGVGLDGVRGGFHVRQAWHDGVRRSAMYSVALHAGEDRTALALPAERHVAAVRVTGELADEAVDLPAERGGGATPTGPIHAQLERALADPLTRGVLLDVDNTAGLAQAEELGAHVADLRAAGKPVVAYLESGGTRADLLLASACDRVVTTPRASFDSLGTARAARRAGVVDTIGYREDALALLARRCRLRPASRAIDLEHPRAARREWCVPARVAVVYASGTLVAGESDHDPRLGPTAGAATLARQIEQAFRRRSVRAVVLRVESAGGSALACDLVDHTLARLERETGKPLVVSLGGVAASGGYHIALPGTRVLADRFTRTGAIGRFESWPEGSAPAAAAVDEARQAVLDELATRRTLRPAALAAATAAHAVAGDEALALGLVDGIGGLAPAISEARRLARIPAGEEIAIAEYRRPVAEPRGRHGAKDLAAARRPPAPERGPFEHADVEPAR